MVERRRLGRGRPALRRGAGLARLEEALAGAPAASVGDVVVRMEAVAACFPRADGVACFTTLYLAVTRAIEAALPRSFASPEFLVRLDLRFAALYFDALRAFARGGDPEAAPKAWAPLLEARSRKGVAPLQFALAGMNAHINRDLPLALVDTCRELGVDLRRDGPEHGDFLAVNALLEETQERVKADFATGPIGVLDRLLGSVDDVVAMWNVARARDAAWTNAETLWALREDRPLADAFLLTLDRTVGFAGRGLLRPAVPAVVGLLRRVFR